MCREFTLLYSQRFKYYISSYYSRSKPTKIRLVDTIVSIYAHNYTMRVSKMNGRVNKNACLFQAVILTKCKRLFLYPKQELNLYDLMVKGF